MLGSSESQLGAMPVPIPVTQKQCTITEKISKKYLGLALLGVLSLTRSPLLIGETRVKVNPVSVFSSPP